MDDLIGEFLTETNEGLEELDQDMVDLEQNPNDQELLGKIFRLIHTIKGTCGFLGLPRLEKVAHHAENVLGRFRDGDLEVLPEYVTLIFESIDRIKEIVSNIENTGGEGSGDDTPLIKQLDIVFEGKNLEDAEEAAPAPAAEEPAAEPKAESVEAPADTPASGLAEGTVGLATEDELEAAFQAAEMLPVDQLKAELEAKGIVTDEPEEKKDTKSAAEKTDAPEAKAAAGAPVATTQTLRVSVDVLENLMTTVSELVLTRNQLLQIARSSSDGALSASLQRLNQIVSELQEGVMQTRMQPIGNAWAKLPRIIRDLSMDLGKKIDLQMKGKETELDRQVLELIKDPLTHMVRNSADHGIEMPEDRKMLGKKETGTIVLNAYHEGGHIIIEIADDGKGLAVGKIKAKILANGLATPEELEEMTDQQVQRHIFKAGFSTAEAVTAVSGRGVGMDVVRTNIEKIGGSIDLNSIEGKGSTFTIKIPLTLAIVSALIVEAGGERFAIPQLTVRELVMTSPGADSQIETINGSPVLRLRESLLPLVRLDEVLKLKKPSLAEAAAKAAKAAAPNEDSVYLENDAMTEQDGAKAVEASKGAVKNGNASAATTMRKVGYDAQYIVVSQVGSYQFGIVVDRVFDTEEIVVKPVCSILRDLEIFSGNTILGDGSVVMILDPAGITRMTGAIEDADAAAGEQDNDENNYHVEKKVPLLIFMAGDEAPKAVPLSLVARLEQIEGPLIERTGNDMVIQYRGDLMNLIPFSEKMDIDFSQTHPVLVFSDKGKTLGLIVGDILDITESAIEIQHSSGQKGVIGSSIVNGRATDVVDVGYYLDQSDRQWFTDHDENTPFDGATDSGANGRRKLLLVDDSPFFRNMLTPLLNVAGFDVTSLDSAAAALKMRDKGENFDMIISDIEMPDMNGFEFAKEIRSTDGWAETPMLALSSHATEQDIERGKQVGFNEYVAKFDRGKLVETISQTLAKFQEE